MDRLPKKLSFRYANVALHLFAPACYCSGCNRTTTITTAVVLGPSFRRDLAKLRRQLRKFKKAGLKRVVVLPNNATEHRAAFEALGKLEARRK